MQFILWLIVHSLRVQKGHDFKFSKKNTTSMLVVINKGSLIKIKSLEQVSVYLTNDI